MQSPLKWLEKEVRVTSEHHQISNMSWRNATFVCAVSVVPAPLVLCLYYVLLACNTPCSNSAACFNVGQKQPPCWDLVFLIRPPPFYIFLSQVWHSALSLCVVVSLPPQRVAHWPPVLLQEITASPIEIWSHNWIRSQLHGNKHVSLQREGGHLVYRELGNRNVELNDGKSLRTF